MAVLVDGRAQDIRFIGYTRIGHASDVGERNSHDAGARSRSSRRGTAPVPPRARYRESKRRSEMDQVKPTPTHNYQCRSSSLPPPAPCTLTSSSLLLAARMDSTARPLRIPQPAPPPSLVLYPRDKPIHPTPPSYYATSTTGHPHTSVASRAHKLPQLTPFRGKHHAKAAPAPFPRS